MYKRYGFIVLLITLALAMPLTTHAKENPNIDAVLVLDASNSMNSTDPKKLSIEAMKMFIDMTHSSGDKIGIVAYTDQIEREKALLTVANEEDKQTLKEFVSQLKRGKYTDISVGLSEAVKILDQGRDTSHKPIIIILADGNNELNPNGAKSLDDADREVNEAVERARSAGYPVYTIGLNANGGLNQGYLENISNKTGGKSFETRDAGDLPIILSEILADHLRLKMTSESDLIGDDRFQDVVISIPDSNVEEANVTLLTENPVELRLIDNNGNEAAIPSINVIFSQSQSYSMLKLMRPQKGEWILKVKGISGDRIRVNLLYNYDINLRYDILPQAHAVVGDKLVFSAYFYDGTNKITDTDLYKNVTCELLVYDRDNGTQTSVAAVNNGSVFEAEYILPEARKYAFVMRAAHSSFTKDTVEHEVDVSLSTGTVSTPPQQNTSKDTPSATTDEAVTESEDSFGLHWIILIILGVIALAVAAVFLLKQIKRSNTRFAGKFVIEILDKYSGEMSSAKYKYLDKMFGTRATLHQLLDDKPEYRALESVVFTPVKGTESYNPQVLIKNNGSDCKIKKDYVEINASKGYAFGFKSKLTILLEKENKEIIITYIE